jgi:hypothetical protein
VVAVALATTVFALRNWRRWSVALFFLIVLGGQLLLSNAVKYAVERVRPDAPPLHVLSGPSFPGGHATTVPPTHVGNSCVNGPVQGTAAAVSRSAHRPPGTVSRPVSSVGECVNEPVHLCRYLGERKAEERRMRAWCPNCAR